jgi:aryl-alcohol dehydrogenase-like predicted oxidoreductase
MDAMEQRTLGTLTTSAIGYGAMVLEGLYGAADGERSLHTLRHAIDAGATFLDTADAYGADGANEALVGRAIAGRRDEVQVATKWGITGAPSDTARRVPHEHAQDIWVDPRPERAREAAEASLRRLGVEAIDLWYLHFPDPGVPVEESVGAMAELVDEGKVRHLGICNATAEQVLAAHQAHPLAAVQAEYSLWTRGPEAVLLPALRELGVGFVAWGPLGNGFLAGNVAEVGQDDFRRNAPRFRAREPRPQPRSLRAAARPGRGARAHAGTARARLAAAPGREPGAHPRHADAGAPRREPRSGGRRARRRHAAAHRRAGPRRGGGGCGAPLVP